METPTIHELPSFLDDFIYNSLHAVYRPDFVKFEYNLELESNDLLIYLGTYFPRSFCEIREICKELNNNTDLFNYLHDKETIRILDFGCGSGGELIGLAMFLNQLNLPLKKLEILGIDGNPGALRLLDKISKEISKHVSFEIDCMAGPIFVGSEEDLNIIGEVLDKPFDFILAFKSICELVARERITTNAYYYCAKLLSKYLAQEGVMVFVDVTIKNSVINQFLPIYMSKGLSKFITESNNEFHTIYPNICSSNEHQCTSGCFYNKRLTINHSRRKGDKTKITYRVMCRSEFFKKLHIDSKETISCVQVR